MLNVELTNTLIEALESGTYERGMGQLRQCNTFCVMGVACDLVRDRIGAKWDGRVSERFVYDGMWFQCSSPRDVDKLYGFDTKDIHENNVTAYMAKRNDGGSTFPVLATVLRTLLQQQQENGQLDFERIWQ